MSNPYGNFASAFGNGGAAAVMQAAAAPAGRGRGRAATMPAWMTNGDAAGPAAGPMGAGPSEAAAATAAASTDPGVVVTNLAGDLTESELQQFFSTCGTVTDISISDPASTHAMRQLLVVYRSRLTDCL